jgi:quercetin dioxygenase-like cupin family protein
MTVKKQLIESESKGQWMEAAPGEHFLIRVPGSETNNSYSVTEFLSAPGSSTPIHRHEREDEYLLVVEGTVRVLYGEKTFDATAGTMISLLRGIQHAWGNPTDRPVRVIMAAVPGGCEEALRVIARTNRDQLDLPALAKKYAVTNIGPFLWVLNSAPKKTFTQRSQRSQRHFQYAPSAVMSDSLVIFASSV